MDFTRRRVIRKLNSYLAIAASAGSALFIFTFLGSGGEIPLPEIAEPVLETAEREREPREHYEAIAERNLFGLSSTEEAGPEPEPESPPEPGLPDLKLKGTIILSSGGGYAVLLDPDDGVEKTVSTGDEIKGMELVSVGWNSAVLRGSPGEMELTIDTQERPAASGRMAESDSPAPGRRLEGERRRTYEIPQSRVYEAIGDAQNIMRDIRVRPTEEGLSVSGIRRGSLADEFGLEDGDVIKSVNGRRLEGPDSIVRVYSEVLRQGSATVEVERNGRRVNLRYEIER